MTTFIQLHLLTAYPAANLNRDDTGAPKTVVLGGATRLRVSSQSLKRAWRTSALFEQALAGHIGIRSGRIAREAATILIEKGIEDKKAIEWSAKIADYLGKAKNDKKPKDPLTNAETEQLVHISPAEFDAVKALAHQLAEEKRAPKEEDLALLRKDRMAVDIAMFGRMLANKPEFNVEAACQVAHAFGVSETIVEDDFFTAVDDLRQASEDAGAGHLGETGFGSALFYTYICIDKDLLVENLGGDEALANQTIRAFTEAALKVSPTGKQNSFASRAYASWALAEKGTDQPRSLAAAFYEPINGTRQLEVAVQRITTLRETLVVCASRNPRWARDYHTVQMPKEVRKARYFSRREELSDPELLSAIISRRDYYTDAWWMVAVATTPDAPYSLEQLQDGLRHPVFPLYLGRKSHPLALPLAPLLLEGNASDVLRNAYQQYQDRFRELKVSLPKLQDECWWEGEHDGLVASKILRRRDVPLNRQQWLFGERTINQGPWLSKEEPCTSQE
ncbi:type I-E CRISPR-associated protein Cas7/Cse4/CasC [Escherichia coli]|nr:type I-E CRISPR-associated protein Cas7/Cse4/CasC [Escherichia coli]